MECFFAKQSHLGSKLPFSAATGSKLPFYAATIVMQGTLPLVAAKVSGKFGT